MKEQELKKQFQLWEQKRQAPPLKSDHATEFLLRLNKRKKNTHQKRMIQWAAIALVCIGLGGAFQMTQQEESNEVRQFQKAEFHLMQMIGEQINVLENLNSPETQEVLERSKNQLQLIQNDYQRLYQQWEVNPSQPKLIQALIANLNTQINLLTEINATLKTLNETNYENLKI